MTWPFYHPPEQTARDNLEVATNHLVRAKAGLAKAWEAAQHGDSSQLGYWSEQVSAWQHQINLLTPTKAP